MTAYREDVQKDTGIYIKKNSRGGKLLERLAGQYNEKEMADVISQLKKDIKANGESNIPYFLATKIK